MYNTPILPLDFQYDHSGSYSETRISDLNSDQNMKYKSEKGYFMRQIALHMSKKSARSSDSGATVAADLNR